MILKKSFLPKVKMSKVQIYMVSEGAEKTTMVKIKRIRHFDSTWFGFPESLQPISCHKQLLELPIVKAAAGAIKGTRGHYRNILVLLSEELAKVYMDELGNFMFADFVLGEINVVSSSNPPVLVSEQQAVEKSESVSSILKHFIIEKFSPKNKNVEAWIAVFEKESARFKLSGAKQIEVFRSCLDPSLAEWFNLTQRKIGLDAGWGLWRTDFIDTFNDVSWNAIRYAFNYKFLNGSLTEYAIKKENMLSELDREIPSVIMLDLIVVGLPIYIQDSLNRLKILTVKDLIKKLKKFEADQNKIKSNFVNVKSGQSFSKNSNGKNIKNRKPCDICAKKGFPNRLHAEEVCWNKSESKKINKAINNVILDTSDSSSSDENSKN